MKKVGVTGGAGFIGGYVCEELLERGYTPVVFDHHKHTQVADGVEFFLGDARDDVAMTELAAHVDGIIHLAAVLGTQETVENPRPAAQSNLMGGLNFLEAVAQYKIAGTYIAVGNWFMNNSYSISKNMIERFTHMFNKDRGTHVNIVRAVNAYGPRQLAAEPFAHGKVRKITPALICRALSGMPMELYGGGTQVSDMVYVGDVAKALVGSLEAADKGIIFDDVIGAGSTTPHTILSVAEKVNDIIEKKGYQRVPIVSLPMRKGEKEGAEVRVDASTLEKIGMGVSNLVQLEEGLERTIDYYIATEGDKWHNPNK